MVKVSMPARFNFTPAPIPPNPAPMMATRGVPVGPNSLVAVELTAAGPSQSPTTWPRSGGGCS